MNPPKLRTGVVSAAAFALSAFDLVVSTPCARSAEGMAAANAAASSVRFSLYFMCSSGRLGEWREEIDRLGRKGRTKAGDPCDKNSQKSPASLSGEPVRGDAESPDGRARSSASGAAWP